MVTLVSEKRPDKTGKLVTRWVKPGLSGQGAAQSIAAPSLGGTPAQKSQEDKDFYAAVAGSFKRSNSKRDVGFARFHLHSSPRQFTGCVAVLREHEGFKEVFGYLVTNGHSPQDTANVAVVYDPDLFTESPSEDQANHFGSAVTGFLLSGVGGRQKGHNDLSESSDEVREAARDFARLDDAFHDEEEGMGRSFARWALTETDHDIDSIIRVVKEHHLTDIQSVQAILDGIVPALIDGAL